MAHSTAAFGAATFVAGAESFLVERETKRVIAELRRRDPSASWTQIDAADLTPNEIMARTGADLFSTGAIACFLGLERLPKESESSLLALLDDIPATTAVICTHAGGNAGRALAKKVRDRSDLVIECPAVKPWELPRFLRDEAAREHGALDQAAAHHLVDALGPDLRTLSAAIAQLIDDSEDRHVTLEQAKRYFAGRAHVTSFAVADHAVAGRAGEAIVALRWALTTGVAPVLITAAVATQLRQLGRYLAAGRNGAPSAASVGVPPWKLKDIAHQARSWSEPAIASAIRATGRADADIKGAAHDASFALERLILRVVSARRAAFNRPSAPQ
ncbi:MAG: DNA polymerase III subunit delta [Propionibacteriaceae bacterium]|jgi:DNA polymerase-3 subunit delta|nr:DNA polymerase III subunit delta [Propionibacteriaceae bacterium]